MRAQVEEALAPAPRQGDANTLDALGELVDQLNPMVVQNSSAAVRLNVHIMGMKLVTLAKSGGDGDDHEEEGKTGEDPSPPPAPPAPREPLPEEAGKWPKAFIELLREKKVKCTFTDPNPKRAKSASAARYDGYMRSHGI